jgi:hypothetical protein
MHKNGMQMCKNVIFSISKGTFGDLIFIKNTILHSDIIIGANAVLMVL